MEGEEPLGVHFWVGDSVAQRDLSDRRDRTYIHILDAPRNFES